MTVVIISTDGESTYNVIDWLHHFKIKVHLIDDKNRLHVNSVQLSKNNHLRFEYDNKKIDLMEIHSFWHRRGNISIAFPAIKYLEDFDFEKQFVKHLDQEQRKLKEYFNFEFRQKKHLGNIFQTDINKLIVLEKAQRLGIAIPDTLITSNKEELLNFKSKYQSIICKPLSDGLMAHDLEIGIITYYTNIISDDNLKILNNTFTVSLFQEKIEKKYELRIFFIDGDFYTMAIFSQEDTKTSVDFRKYNYVKPNRTVPYNLPVSVKDMLKVLMRELNLNTGSIDMAVTLKNDYVFFEINPIGQFGMTSYPCNYYLEKKIANYLSN